MRYSVASVCLIMASFLMLSCSQESGPRLVHTLNGEDWELVSAVPGEGEDARYYMDGYPDGRSIPATVPGDIHWDLMRAGQLPDIFIGMNAKKTYPYALKEWWYRKTFTISKAEWENKHIRLNFEGVDYDSKIWLNGHLLGSHTGQFTPFGFDVSEKINFGKANELIILIKPAPKNIIDAFVDGNRWATNAYTIINETLKFWKSRTMTGWDWGTRLWSMGVWQDVTITATEDIYLDRLLVFPQTQAPYHQAKLRIELDVNTLSYEEIEISYKAECITNEKAPKAFGAQLINTGGVNKQIEGFLEVEDPALWWPNGYGAQNLYLLTVTAKDQETGRVLDQVTTRFGIRDIQYLENPGADDFPQPARVKKFLTKINGQKIFLHGGNWLPADLLYGRPGKKEYEHLIRMAALANYNVFRIWSGGLIDKQIFYDLCDQYGILVYQEMPIAQRHPLETQEILDNMAKEQRLIMPLLINHPSVFRYGFGNELDLFKENSIHVRQFLEICAELDPLRAVNESDPFTGYQRHGPHWFNFPGSYVIYNTGFPMHHGPSNPVEWTEYGSSGASSVETIKKIIPDGNHWPISPIDTLLDVIPDFPLELTPLPTATDSLWRWRNGLAGFCPLCWLSPDIYRGLFGELPDLETEVQASQFAHAEGLRYANQSHRRAKWHRSGCYMWTFNEPWPNVAHGSIVEYYGLPKMAYFYVRNSYAQIDVSAEYNNISLHPADTLKLPVFVTSAKSGQIDGANLVTQIIDLEGNMYYEDSKKVLINANSSHKIDMLNFIVPTEANNNVLLVRFDLFDDTKGNLSSQTYTFGVNSPSTEHVSKEYLRPMLFAPQAELTVTVSYESNMQWGEDDMSLYKAAVMNNSRVPALFVQLECDFDPDQVYFSNNYFILLPGEERIVNVLVSPGIMEEFKNTDISVKAWNF